MSDSDETGRLGLSRRKLLGSVATLGAAGALGGAGSMAFFSDDEQFANNSLAAGELDLKVDFEEHYSDWIGTTGDPAPDGSTEASFAEMADPEDADYLLPAFQVASDSQFVSGGQSGQLGPLANGIDMDPRDGRPIALTFTEDQDAFWKATSIDAYPDDDDDGVQDQTTGEDGPVPAFPDADDICETNSDTQDIRDSDLRTEGSRGEPLISLQDLKPGDFGEVTLSFHLCDNPGFVWLTGDLVDADENGTTEPEAEDEDEFGPDADYGSDDNPDDLFDNEGDEADDPGSTDPDETEQERVELLDYTLTRIWRDDGAGQDADAGNNQVDLTTGRLDVVCAIDRSSSLNGTEEVALEDGVTAFIADLADSGADVNVGTVTFGKDEVEITNDVQPADSDVFDGVEIDVQGGSNTPLPPALDISDQLLYGSTGSRSDARKVVVVFTDGGPNYGGDDPPFKENQYSASDGTTTYLAPRDDSTDWSAGSDGDGSPSYENEGTGTLSDEPETDVSGDRGFVTKGEMDETLLVAESVKSPSVGAGETEIATVYVGDDDEDRQAMTQSAVDEYDTLPTFLATGPVDTDGDDGVATSATNAFDVDVEDLERLSDQLVQLVTAAEKILFFGTLREALQQLSTGEGIPLDGDLPAAEAGGAADARPCFDGGTTNYVGFEWWLPINHGNQIQGDSVQFDLGFYAEQCRHNDGVADGDMGNDGSDEPETTTVTIEGFPGSDDEGNSLEQADLNFDFDASGVTVDELTIDGDSLDIGEQSLGNGDQTLELRSIGGSVSLSTDFPATFELSGVPTGLGSRTVGIVFEPDDDSAEDDTATFST
jgi:predicted ribosomally synthesized peptide with SipW-like signal peptide